MVKSLTEGAFIEVKALLLLGQSYAAEPPVGWASALKGASIQDLNHDWFLGKNLFHNLVRGCVMLVGKRVI